MALYSCMSPDAVTAPTNSAPDIPLCYLQDQPLFRVLAATRVPATSLCSSRCDMLCLAVFSTDHLLQLTNYTRPCWREGFAFHILCDEFSMQDM